MNEQERRPVDPPMISLDAMPIVLTTGEVCWVDQIDHEWASSRPWHGIKRGQVYAQGTVGWSSERRRSVTGAMHREIAKRMGLGSPRYLDHEDRNALNNTRSNLRVATAAQNQANKDRSKNNTSGFKGVHWDKANRAWRARIGINYRKVDLGLHATAELAARSYDIAAKQAWGVFANLNFPENT